MKICQSHWTAMRATIDRHGLSDLIAKDGEAAMQGIVAELEGDDAAFDPLMSMHWHYMNWALGGGGLYLLGPSEDGSNDGAYCPVCELITHIADFNADQSFDEVAQAMVKHCIDKGLIASS